MTFTDKEVKEITILYSNETKKLKKRPSKIVMASGRTVGIGSYLELPQIKDAINRINSWIKNHNQTLPNYVNICGFNLMKSEYQILFSITTPKVTPTRFVSSGYMLSSSWVKQDYDSSCALNSLQESFYKLTKIKVSESTMYKLGYTNSSGTGHDGIKAIVNWLNKNYKSNISVEFKNLKDFGKTSKEQWTKIGELMSKSNVAVFFHIYYRNGGNSCTSAITSQDHGHYEVLDIINVGTGYVRALNSLSGGYLQDRKISVQECFMKKISQPSVIILTKK